MRSAAILVSALMISVCCLAQRPATTNESPLPKYMTDAEKRLPRLPVEGGTRTPPAGDVHWPAEYAPCEGIFFAWEGYDSLLTAMTVTITTSDEETKVFMVVDSSGEQSNVTSTLSAAGADLDQVEFIVRGTDSVWIRDYGPRFIFENGNRAIVDHTYNRPRPNDNLLNDYVSSQWGEPQYQIPLTHGGGNFHLFDTGDGFMTDLILTENSGMTQQQVENLYAQYQGLDLTIYPGFPTSFDSTQHIDMWMLPCADDVIIIGQYQPSDGSPYTITENAVADLTARGYTVHRTPGWQSGWTHYTYTNAVIINGHVFVPQFNNATNDAIAMTVFGQAFPGYQLHPLNCSGIITAAGALHCISMHVPAVPLGMRVTPGNGLIAEGPVGGPFIPDSVTYTVMNSSDVTIDYSVTKAAPWLTITNATGTLAPAATANVTVALNAGAETLAVGSYTDTVEFVNLTDHSGDTARNVSLQVGAATPVYTYPLDTDPGWSMTGQWAFGQPTGQGGSSHGNPDPASGATGSNVLGVNLNGDYATVSGGPYYVTLGPVDLSNVTEVELRFKRWLNTDYMPYAQANVQMSTNGMTWQTLWENGTGGEIADSSWVSVELPAAAANNQATAYFRWGYQARSDAYAYSGWNIDDIEVWGLDAGPSGCPGDANCDGSISWRDIDYFVAAMNDNVPAWEAMFAPGAPSCPFDNNDVNEDGTVSWRDIDPLVALMNTVCP